MFLPHDANGVVLESRRICRNGTTTDAETLRRLAELLTPPEDVDAVSWLERQVATVRAYVRDYARICETNPEQAREWGGYMLETRLIKSTRSAWEVLTNIVDRWREAQAEADVAARQAAAEARTAEARAVAERLDDLAGLARNGEPAFARDLRAAGQAAPLRRDHIADHAAARRVVEAAHAEGRAPTLAEINTAVAAVPALDEPLDKNAKILDTPRSTSGVTPLPPMPPMQHVVEPPPRELTEDEEAEIRERGRRREGQVAFTNEQLLSRRINTIVREFTERAGRPPTPEESEEISRLVRGSQGATGT